MGAHTTKSKDDISNMFQNRKGNLYHIKIKIDAGV